MHLVKKIRRLDYNNMQQRGECMTNYRRLISYIYAYEGGVKKQNIGYAKIEVRNGQCRIQVSVKKVYVGSSEIGVYLLAPSAELLLGRIFVRSGAGEFRMQVSGENVEGSGLSIEDFYGLSIHDVESSWQSYTTIWEDAVAQAAELQLADVTAENARKKETQVRAASAGAELAEDLEYVNLEKEEALPAELSETESDAMESKPEGTLIHFPISEEIERELAEEEERLETVTPWEEEVPDSGEADQEEPEQQKPNQQEPEQQESEQGNLDDASLQDPEQLRELDRLEQEETMHSSLWNRLQRQYTKVLAFEYDNGCEILSIKPQDIGLLPRETWVYGNNSFLLHGYYNYRHLILARLSGPQDHSRYLLGVPGHYFSNEKHLASMFGFPHFVLAKKQPEEDGRFGYWYTDIRL